MSIWGRITGAIADFRESVSERISGLFNRGGREEGDAGLEEKRGRGGNEKEEVAPSSFSDASTRPQERQIITDEWAIESNYSIEETEDALSIIEKWGGDFTDLSDLLDLGLAVEEIEYINILESAPYGQGVRLRYEFPNLSDALAWTLDVGAYGYFAIADSGNGWGVWELNYEGGNNGDV